MPEWRVPGYTELKMIGSGGFGDVVLARHDASGTLVAIKYLRPDLLTDPGFAQMFRGEATVLASLDDPNVVRLYEYVEAPYGAAIVMELIGGVSLREILRFHGKTTAEAALAVLQGSLLGLAAAHRRGVVHRDYKPENVLVNGNGVSKLADFGIAARAGDHAVPAGTLAYAAPEQMSGAPASPASDIYAATATFYECLTGRPPFTGETEDLLRQHRSEPVPLDPVPEQLRPLVAVGMAKDPVYRPTDATTFVAELEKAATGAYGRHWYERGRSHLGEAALLLAALWPSGPPPATQGDTVQQIPLRRRAKSHHISALKAAIAASVVIAAAAATAALAATGSPGPTASAHPAAAVRPISLQPSPSPSLSSPPTSFSQSPSIGGGGSTSTSTATGGSTATSTATGGSTSTATGGSTSTATGGGSTSTASTGGGGSTGGGSTTAPGSPGSVAAVAASQYTITVTWADTSAGITGFHVDNGCPVGSCSPGATLTQTTGAVDSATFNVTPGTYQCFRVQAFNSAGASPWVGWGCVSTPGLVLSGTQEWTNTNVTVAAGDTLGITASGQLTIGETGTVGPAGDQSCIPAENYPEQTFPAPNLHCWSLIARIGNGTPFEVGTSALVTAGSGVLYLGVNTDSFSGNSGSWTVNVKLGGLPPPP